MNCSNWYTSPLFLSTLYGTIKYVYYESRLSVFVFKFGYYNIGQNSNILRVHYKHNNSMFFIGTILLSNAKICRNIFCFSSNLNNKFIKQLHDVNLLKLDIIPFLKINNIIKWSHKNIYFIQNWFTCEIIGENT